MVSLWISLLREDFRAEPWAGIWVLTCVAQAAYAVAFTGC